MSANLNPWRSNRPNPAGSVTVEQVSKNYPGAQRGAVVEALQPISLELREADFVSILGPSGCGKSSLLRIIAGLEQPTTGRVLLNGTPVSGPGTDRGMMFQSYSLFPWLTVRDNIGYGLRERGLAPAAQAAIVDSYVAEMGLEGFDRLYPVQLSGGMRQRVAFARALANDPKILLLDEPFGQLDNQTRALMQEFLLGLWERHRKTVLFVTHDIDEAIFLSNRCAVFTARPGAIKSETRIELPYPRHYTVKSGGRFSDYRARLTEEIRAESLKSTQVGPAFLGT
ncbi:MAG TPA: ABC transporter ATP-binding protein [Burkholderiaceae bacterium]|nr:ABC transporter ATP-binding protein [Burkholderiaceae bacterium]